MLFSSVARAVVCEKKALVSSAKKGVCVWEHSQVRVCVDAKDVLAKGGGGGGVRKVGSCVEVLEAVEAVKSPGAVGLAFAG